MRRTITPEIIPVTQGAIQNAGAGTEVWHGGEKDGLTNLVKYAVRVSDYSVNSMIRVKWTDYEMEEGKYLFEKMDRNFEYCIKYGQKLTIGCFLTSDSSGPKIDGALCAYPAYVHEALQKSPQKDIKYEVRYHKLTRWEPNFENSYFFERYNALLKAFAEYLEQPLTVDGKTVQRRKMIRYIEMRHFGFWGEGAYPKKLIPANSACLIQFADSFARNLSKIRILVPTNGMVYVPSLYDSLKDYHFHLLTTKNEAGLFGIFRDNWGWDERSSYFQKIYYPSNKYEKDGVRMYELIRDRWKVAPLIGEPGQTYPKGDFHPYSCLMQQVNYMHPAVVRNCNVSTGAGKSVTNPTTYTILKDQPALDQFHQAYSIIGFRYLFTSAEVEREGCNLSIAINWLNIGLTPTYDVWDIRFFIKDESGKEIWSGVSSLDLRTILPSDNLTPGVVDSSCSKRHTDRFSGVPKNGRLYLEIVDPVGVSPNMALSIKGRTIEGAYPL
ncbi:MAG: hypothetical protein PF904_21300 [Kiritimatiellae bacterium]|nr:hypothetical protein [Kiritimatiellia bacterium]